VLPTVVCLTECDQEELNLRKPRPTSADELQERIKTLSINRVTTTMMERRNWTRVHKICRNNSIALGAVGLATVHAAKSVE
jgi:hypothetical protein